MEPINKLLLGLATLAYSEMTHYCNNIIPLRDYIGEHLFMKFLSSSSDYNVEVCYRHVDVDITDSSHLYDVANTSSYHYLPSIATYGKGIYVTPFIDYAYRCASYGSAVVAMLVIRGKTAEGDEIVTCGDDMLADSQCPKPNILVVRSPCQVLPIFAMSYANCHLRSPKGYDMSEEYVNDVLCVSPSDPSLMPCVELLKTEYPNVKYGVIYQLIGRFMRERQGDELDINDAYLYVNDTLRDFDYECY